MLMFHFNSAHSKLAEKEEAHDTWQPICIYLQLFLQDVFLYYY